MNKFSRKIISLTLCTVLILTSTTVPMVSLAESVEDSVKISENAQYAKGEAIVLIKNDSPSTLLSSKTISVNFGSGMTIKNSYTIGDGNDAVKIASFCSSSLSTKQLIAKLRLNPFVKAVTPNYQMHTSNITDDTYSKYQWALENNGQNGGTPGNDVNPETLWDRVTGTDKEQIIAVLDTGIDYTNEDLKDSLWVNPYGAKLSGKYGYDFTGTTKDHSPMDDNGHGSHIAGIIAAQADNQTGISGINKSAVKIMSLKWLDSDGVGYIDDAIAAYEYICRAMELGANIVAVNNSWGGIGEKYEQEIFDAMFDEIGKNGAASIIAAGNDGTDIGKTDPEYLWFDDEEGEYCNVPTSSESDYAVVVAASNENDELASFSSYSEKYVDVAAPGTNILSTVSYNCFNPTIYSGEQIKSLCGSYQDYNSQLTEDSFGYPKAVDSYSIDSKTTVQTTSTISPSDSFFGADGGKSISITTGTSSDKSDEYQAFIYTIDYELETADDDYTFSFMMKANNNADILVYDLPQSFDASEVITEDPMSDFIYTAGESDDYWNHLTYTTDIDEEIEQFDYIASAQRQLVFLVFTNKSGTVITIDDLAISKQAVNENDFGKYDFYNGTSMATPYVAGAIALIKAAYPDKDILDVINMAVNTGRVNSSLDGKTSNSKVMTLDSVLNTPPLIHSIAYEGENIAITGNFGNVLAISVNSKLVDTISADESKILIPGGDYDNTQITVQIANEYGFTEKTATVSSKSNLVPTDAIEDLNTFSNGFVLPAGDVTYGITSSGELYVLEYDYFEKSYFFYALSFIDCEKIFKNADTYYITSAAYMGGNIFFTVIRPVFSSSGAVIGYDNAFAAYNIQNDTTKSLCEIPNDMVEGFTLAAYNGNILLIGGYNNADSAYSTAVYTYDESQNLFSKSAQLKEGAAYGQCIQYRDKLVYVYGANEKGTMPTIQTFDGKQWTKSGVSLNSSVYEEVQYSDGESGKIYDGSITTRSGGVFCAGSFVSGLGNIFTYNPATDTATPYSKNYTGTNKLYAFMLPQATIYVGACSEDDYGEGECYIVPVKGDYAEVSAAFLSHGYIDTGYSSNFVYGDKIPVNVVPDSGYVATSVSANGVKYPVTNSTAQVVIKDALTTVTASLKKVSPAKVTGLSVSSTTSTGYTLKWTPVSGANGYRVQQYKNGKWTTVKTISSASTVTYKVSKQTAGTNKYRVQAYSVYEGKTYYGTSSSTLTVYVPSKQKISSLKTAKKAFTVSYKKNSSATGYQVQYSTSSTFKSYKTVTVKSNKTVSKTVSGLSSGKKYYVRIRSYKTVNGKNIYGAWSAAKSVTTK